MLVQGTDLEGIVITDVEWFMQGMCALQDERQNPSTQNTTFRALPTGIPIFTKRRIAELWKTSSEQVSWSCSVFPRHPSTDRLPLQLDLVVLLLRSLSILVDVPSRAVKGQGSAMVLFSHLPEKIHLWVDGRSSKECELQVSVTSRCCLVFSNFSVSVQKLWPSGQKSPALDQQMERYYIFPDGLPVTFFPRLMQESIQMGQVIFVSERGFIIRCGAAEMLIRHSVDSSECNNFPLGGSTVHLQLRLTSWVAETKKCVLREYMACILSRNTLLVESLCQHYSWLSCCVSL